MSVDVSIAALDTAATELESVATELQAIDVAGAFAGIEAALPGSAVPDAAVWVATRVGAAVQVLGDNVRAMSASATGSANGYRAADGSVETRFGAMVAS
jgi:hypothetical protein